MNTTKGLPEEGYVFRTVEILLQNNSTKTQVMFDGQLRGIVRVQLDEYSATNASTGQYVVKFTDGAFASRNLTNTNVAGTMLSVPAANTHTIYPTPRILSEDTKDGMSLIGIELTNVNGTAITFDTFYMRMTIIMVPPQNTKESRKAYRANLSHMSVNKIPNSERRPEWRNAPRGLPMPFGQLPFGSRK